MLHICESSVLDAFVFFFPGVIQVAVGQLTIMSHYLETWRFIGGCIGFGSPNQQVIIFHCFLMPAAKAKDFSLFHRVQTGSGAHPSSTYPVGTGGCFPGYDAYYSPPSRSEYRGSQSHTILRTNELLIILLLYSIKIMIFDRVVVCWQGRMLKVVTRHNI
jgi:hypothetical protein